MSEGFNSYGPFKKDGKFLYDGKEISNSLKTEYTSQMIGGDVRNRFTGPPAKKFLIPSLTTE